MAAFLPNENLSFQSPSHPFDQDVVEEKKKIVIIGAGAAGLSAAKFLLENCNETCKIEITIVEASNYIGGRIKTCPTFIGHGHKIDIGAEYIHGSNTVLTNLIHDSLNISVGPSTDFDNEIDDLYEKDVEPIFITSQGDGGPDENPTSHGLYGGYYLANEDLFLPYNSDDNDFKSLNEILWEMSENKENDENFETNDEDRDWEYPDDPNLSMKDYLVKVKNIPERMLPLAIAGYANTAGCSDLENISYAATRSFEQFWDKHEIEGDYRLHSKHSMGAVVDALVRCITNNDASDNYNIRFEKAKILLNWKVDRIQYAAEKNHEKKIIIHSNNGELLYADACIISVPTSIINSKAITFQPPLPKFKTEAFAMVGMDSALKIILKFSSRLWPKKLQSIVCADCPIPEIWFREFRWNENKSNCHIAVCYLMSKAADHIIRHGIDNAINVAKGQLQTIFRISTEKMNKSFLSHLVYDWSKHETIRGGYAYPKVGIRPKHYRDMACSLDNELFFCGEGTHLGACMTVQAAMETGIRAGQEVLSSLL